MKKTLIILCFILQGLLGSSKYLAVLDIEPVGLTDTESTILTEALTSKVIQIDQYNVVERNNINKILDEQKFQHSGCTDSECAVKIGQLLNADLMIIGNVGKLGSTYTMNARMIDVETGMAITSATYTHTGKIDNLLKKGVEKIAKELMGISTYSSESNGYSSNDTFENILKDGGKVIGDLIGISDYGETFKQKNYIIDEYQFSSAAKMREFKNKKIILKKKNSYRTREFIDDNINPVFNQRKGLNILENQKYHLKAKFTTSLDSEKISELELFRIIDTTKYQELVQKYNAKIKVYNDTVESDTSYAIKFSDYNPAKHIAISYSNLSALYNKEKRRKFLVYLNRLLAIGLVLQPLYTGGAMDGESSFLAGITPGFIGGCLVEIGLNKFFLSPVKKTTIEVINKRDEFVLNSNMKYDEIKEFVDIYNRKLYEEINTQ